MVCIGRPVNGISLNGLEYVYHDDGVLARFEDDSDDDIEDEGIMFVDESEVIE